MTQVSAAHTSCSALTGRLQAKLLKTHTVAFLLIMLKHTCSRVLEEMFNFYYAQP